MDIEKMKEKFKEEGFPFIYEWKDEPDIEYPPHSHKAPVALYVVEGEVVFNFGEKEIILKKGDRFDVPQNTEHIAKTGSQGCTFLVAEMVEGDS
jgi:quercetin dioxygenase-like cupin family protein